ncbi:ATP-binding protein [Ramlibacter tataouinensis]|uniref:histidine kinase n=1 Tax=Ramlibacter tataouinensis (strain ATCC BAA-407 / DSM 14655 / LMG 21543 / TTB310) TaxID=365046 RepID=F5Y662_RAMTT|nr:ATP-binding protein [Ramlibacter tataouinensis]AEG92748.1 candidate histidine kinase, hybrid [Ramlibacter tataouinensis TTB310]
MNPLRAGTLRQRLDRILSGTTLLALGVAGLALLAFNLGRELRYLEQDLVTQGDIVALASSAALAFDDTRAAAEALSALRANPSVTAAALYDTQGELFASFFQAQGQRQLLPEGPDGWGRRLDTRAAVVWRPVELRGERVGLLYLQVQHGLVRSTLEYLAALAGIMSLSLAAALLLSRRLHREVMRPLHEVSEVARAILRGETPSLRARKTSDDEAGALVDAFNAMLDELDRRARTLREANDALRASEQRYQLAVRGSSAGLWDWDLGSRTLFLSPRFKALLGYTEQEFPDRPSSTLRVLHEDDRALLFAAMRGHLRHGRPFQVECRLRDATGRWRWFFVAGMAQRDDAGRAYRMAGSVIDVTERKEAEQVLQEANRAKDEFLATLAHELRNPLAPIRTGLDILKKDKANGTASQRARETMERQLAHMIRLIDDLLDISRINSGKIHLAVERIRLRGVIDSAVEVSRPAMAAGGHELQVLLPEAEIELIGDATRLAQAVGNLLNNAAKYTPAGGHIALRARQEGLEAVIEVQDDGVGIPEAMLERVFSLFTQVDRSMERAQGGLGIGLYLVRSLVELHHGSVVAASAGAGRGSLFTVRLPCLPADSAPAAPSAPAGAAGAATEGRKVLLVDDNVDAAETLSLVLDMMGYQVCMVHDGAAVLAAAQAFDPDVILLDIGLPGLSGYDVARQLRREPRFARTVLIAITGWGSERDRREAREAGFDHHLTKPVDVAVLEPLMASVAAAP